MNLLLDEDTNFDKSKKCEEDWYIFGDECIYFDFFSWLQLLRDKSRNFGWGLVQ